MLTTLNLKSLAFNFKRFRMEWLIFMIRVRRRIEENFNTPKTSIQNAPKQGEMITKF